MKSEEHATAVQQGQRDLDPDQDWAAIEAALVKHLFGPAEFRDLTQAQWGEWWKRQANAVARAWSHGDMQTQDEIREAYAWAFKGAVIELKPPEPPVEETSDEG